VCSCVHPEST
jgi:hypothetical protein